MKNKEWNEYQYNYKKANYKQLAVYLDKDVASDLKKKLAQDGLTFSRLVKNAVFLYLYDINLEGEDENGSNNAKKK